MLVPGPVTQQRKEKSPPVHPTMETALMDRNTTARTFTERSLDLAEDAYYTARVLHVPVAKAKQYAISEMILRRIMPCAEAARRLVDEAIDPLRHAESAGGPY